MMYLNKVLLTIIILMSPKMLHAEYILRDLQDMNLGSKSKDFIKLMDCKIKLENSLNRNNINKRHIVSEICLTEKGEILQYSVDKNSDKVVGILKSKNIFLITKSLYLKQNINNSKHKTYLTKKFGKPKVSSILNIEKAMIWVNNSNIIFIDRLGSLGVINKKYVRDLNRRFLDINLIANLSKKEYNNKINKKIRNKSDQKVLKKQLSSLEINRLKKHISKCWKVSLASRDLKEKVKLNINTKPDGSVLNVRILDKYLYKNNTLYRAVSDSARRAVIDCSPLPLPKGKYKTWKNFVLNFDSSLMN